MIRILPVCGYCWRTWDPGAEADCRMCSGRGGWSYHALHAMCFECQDVYRKAVRSAELAPGEAAHLARAPLLRKKLAIELGRAMA